MKKIMASKPLNSQPWFYHWVFSAMRHAGQFDRFGAEQMRRWKVLPDTQSFRERWEGGTASHGWCSTPLVQMSAQILGVTPASPGFKTVSIRPQLCDLIWAKGKVPTPQGPVTVAWSLVDSGLSLDVSVPVGSQAEVVLPASRFDNPTIKLNGTAAAATTRVDAGQHHFDILGKLKPPPGI